MATTKRTIVEQVRRMYARSVDRENVEPVLYEEEIMLLVNQAINTVLQAKTMEAQRIEECEIPQSSLVKYESVAVTSDKLTLPAFPLNLENDMGVWEISDPASPLDVYIPVPLQVAKVFQNTISSNLESQIGYYRTGSTVNFLSTPASAVDVYLLVSDLDQLNDSDPLPLSAAYEAEVIRLTLELLGVGSVSTQELNSLNNRLDLVEGQVKSQLRMMVDTDGKENAQPTEQQQQR